MHLEGTGQTQKQLFTKQVSFTTKTHIQKSPFQKKDIKNKKHIGSLVCLKKNDLRISKFDLHSVNTYVQKCKLNI